MKKASFMITAAAALSLSASGSHASSSAPNQTSPDLSSVGMDKNEGCLTGPIEQFGRYIGDWDIQHWSLSQDGKQWTENPKARWNFTCLGNGVAVQDFWMPASGTVGTNLRMYNPKTESWDIAWTVTGNSSMSHIAAKQDAAGNIVMHYVTPKPTPARRITFMPPTKEGWDWKMEMSSDGEKTWWEVYKIKATLRK